MHSVKKGSKWHFGMRIHIGTDPLYGFVHTISATSANASEVKEAPNLLREDDEVVYGDAGYCKLDRYVTDGKQRRYEINRQRGHSNGIMGTAFPGRRKGFLNDGNPECAVK